MCVAVLCRRGARADENARKKNVLAVGFSIKLNYKSKRKQHFSIRCLDNSYGCSLRNYTHVHEEEWLEKLGPCARAAAAARTAAALNKIKFDESGKFQSLGPRWCVKGFAMDKSVYTGFSEVCLTTTIKMAPNPHRRAPPQKGLRSTPRASASRSEAGVVCYFYSG